MKKTIYILCAVTVLFMALQIGRAWRHSEPPETIFIDVPMIEYAEVKKPVETIVERVEYIPIETQSMEFVVTAYCAENYPHICNDGDAITTATGTTVTPGHTIAVDPRVIPYGTSVYIDGMGLYIAEDCGGAIKWNKIDIAFQTHAAALEFGRQTLKVWILSD